MSVNVSDTVYLKDYEKPTYQIESVCLTFVLDATDTHVTNVMNITRVTPDNEALVLNGELLELDVVILDDRVLHESEYELQGDVLMLHNLPQDFTLEIRNRINPEANKALDGLYRSGGIFCTQNEPEGFRRITYYLDRPDVMSLFRTKIIAKKAENPVLLSNGNLIDSGDLDDGYHFAIWEDPFPKPSYLYALVAGNLGVVSDSFTTRSGREIDLKIYCDVGNESQCEHAMNSLKASMKWDEDRFDREYDLDIYMIVAVDSFNMGAMENKGLNIFNSHYVLASQETATDADFLGIESVIGHEYFHNWTGNRITCRDWFQLTLKEGLTVFRDQSFSADLNDPVVQRIADVSALRSRQFVEDASATSHPIKPSEYLEINNFYTATVYEKGAEVIRMYETLLGREGFKKGMDLYFSSFDGQAVTTEDFLWAMSEANNYDLKAFKQWYSQSGTPTLKVERSFDKVKELFTLTLTQMSSKHNELYFPFRLSLLKSNGKLIDDNKHLRDDIYIINETKTVLEFEGVKEEPALSLNRDFSAPIKLDYEQTQDELAFLMAHDDDVFNRYEASQIFSMFILKDLLSHHLNNQEMEVSQAFLLAYKTVLLDKRLGDALKAKMLDIPGIDMLMQEVDNIDIEVLYKVRNFLLKTVAQSMEREIENAYQSLSDDSYAIDAKSIGHRTLKNKLISMLAPLESDYFISAVKERYTNASNMTDRFTMLKLASNIKALRSDVAQDFYDAFKENSLVMNKYLAVFATSELEGALDVVIALQDDPAYDNIVPNLVRALIGSFTRNYLFFHANDGSGYRFVAEKIIAIDLFNPQIASGLAGAFKSFKKMKASQQDQMREVLEGVLATENLSKNVYEIVSKIVEA
jgi:aminopeptidase N